MMPDNPSESEPVKTDPGDLARVLELELLQKRSEWQQSMARRRLARALSFLFLIIVLGVAAFALVSLFSRMNERVAHRAAPPATADPGK